MSTHSPSSTTRLKTSRRRVLQAGGALLLATLWPTARGRAAQATQAGTGVLVEDVATPFAPNAFIRIAADNTITLILPNIEMGQGIYTSSVMLMAEELGIDPFAVQIEAAPPVAGRKLPAVPPLS